MNKHTKFQDRAVQRTIKPTWGNLASLLTKFSFYVLNALGKRAQRHHARFIKSVSSYSLNCLLNEGVDTMINKMKVSVLSIEKYLAGQRLKDTRPLGAWVALSNGLPSYIPKEFRSMIRSRSLYGLRFILSVLSMYRGFEGTYGLPNYDSITSPKSEGNFRGLHEWFDIFVQEVHGHFPNNYIRLFGMRMADRKSVV